MPCSQEVKLKLLSRVQLFVTPWIIQSMEFSRPDEEPGVMLRREAHQNQTGVRVNAEYVRARREVLPLLHVTQRLIVGQGRFLWCSAITLTCSFYPHAIPPRPSHYSNCSKELIYFRISSTKVCDTYRIKYRLLLKKKKKTINL